MKRRALNSGFAALPSVTLLALFITIGLMLLFRQSLINQDRAALSQLKLDYQQREDALMRALIAVFPSKAVACMKADYLESADYSWSKIFEEAVGLSAASERLPQVTLDALGHASARSAEVGTGSTADVTSWITSLSGVAGNVTPGTTGYEGVFGQAPFAGKVPPRLAISSELQTADAVRPIISRSKVYSAQEPGLLADVGHFPLYNLIPYPNIRFGYGQPGQPFVAKRNWWAFSVNYGNSSTSIRKNYVLSLYEVPSQMPIEAAVFANIGRHGDGSTWSSSEISIDGTIYAKRLAVEGAFGADRLAGGSEISITDPISLGGISIGSSFDSLGVREQLQVDSGTDFLPAALSANSGRLAFLPIQAGRQYLERLPDSTAPTAWQNYAIGAQQCTVKVEMLSMVAVENQTPVRLRITYRNAGGTSSQTTLERGVNWPTVFEAGGDVMPFQTELVGSARSCLTFNASMFSSWLNSLGGADVSINNSIYFQQGGADADATVRAASTPPSIEDTSIIIRAGKDLTAFTKGLSLVTPLRAYVGDDLNDVAASIPAGSGLPSGSVYYPPLSIFATEVRIGTTAFTRPIEVIGQLGTLARGGTAEWKPLDLKSGADDMVHADMISAQLAPLASPAELPPIHQMNWLVVVEELLTD